MYKLIDTLLVLIPALPLAAFLLLAFFGSRLGARAHWPVVATFAGSCILSFLLLVNVRGAINDRIAQIGDDAERNAANATSQANPFPTGWERVVTLWTWADVHDAYTPRPSANTSPVMSGSAN